MSKDSRAQAAARREAREKGYEHRPTTARAVSEAERLNRGLAMVDEEQDGIEADDED